MGCYNSSERKIYELEQKINKLNFQVNNLNERVHQLENTVERHTRRLNRLNQRLRTVENKLNIPFSESEYELVNSNNVNNAIPIIFQTGNSRSHFK
ncbi:hypothetical protein ABEY09_05080 [Bacillus paranthracis]